MSLPPSERDYLDARSDDSAYDQFYDWEAVEIEQRRQARWERDTVDRLVDRVQEMEMRAYLAEQFLAAALVMVGRRNRRIAQLEFVLDQALRAHQALGRGNNERVA